VSISSEKNKTKQLDFDRDYTESVDQSGEYCYLHNILSSDP